MDFFRRFKSRIFPSSDSTKRYKCVAHNTAICLQYGWNDIKAFIRLWDAKLSVSFKAEATCLAAIVWWRYVAIGTIGLDISFLVWYMATIGHIILKYSIVFWWTLGRMKLESSNVTQKTNMGP